MDEAVQETVVDLGHETPAAASDEALRWAEHERHEQVRRAQEDLRAGSQRLTEQQIALVAEVMADVRMLSIKLGR
ncbi:MAG TPA: hypothetical protein VFI52_07945 [Gemmatimonadaceae bacterium]|nr:hypothetical protein [Gemmatimonadaceae bacterium]